MTKRKADPTNESPAYWENILREEGLDMDAGVHRYRKGKKRPYREIHVGGSKNLEDVHEHLVGRQGRVRPQGAGPDE